MKSLSVTMIIACLCSCSVIKPKEDLIPAPVVVMPAPAPMPAPASESMPVSISTEQETTQAFVNNLKDINDLQYGAILLTNKWYTKHKAQSLCNNFIKLKTKDEAVQQGITRDKQFVTYWLINEKIPTEEMKNCVFLAQKYDFEESRSELTIIFHDRLKDMSFFERIYAKSKIRGPFIAIYRNKNELIGLVDLNGLGEGAIEKVSENWNQLLNLAFYYNGKKDSAAGVKYALSNIKGLSTANDIDKINNGVLWTKAGVCVSLVALSVIAAYDGGFTFSAMSTLTAPKLDSYLNQINTLYDAGNVVVKKPENKIFCKAILDIVKK